MTRAMTGLVALLLMLLGSTALACCGHSPRFCFSTQKTIAGAVEMYDLDFNENLQELTPEAWETLVREGYLQSLPRDRAGDGDHTNYMLLDHPEVGIACKVHGVIRVPEGTWGRPRDQMIALGFRDPAFLARFHEELPYDDSRRPRLLPPPLHAGIRAAFEVTQLFTLPWALAAPRR